MKKIIAISMMFALVAGAVFADTTISGATETRFSLAKQLGADGDDPKMGGSIGAAQIKLAGSNAEGTLGGAFRLKQTGFGKGTNGEALYDQVFVWWKPTPQVKVFLGIDQDGLFDTADFVGWGFHSGDNDYIFNHGWDFWRQIFPGNWDGFGLALSFYPIPGLDLNLVLPTGKVGWRQAPETGVFMSRPITDTDSDSHDGMLPGRLRFSGNYSLDFGKVSFVYLGGGVVSDKGSAWLGNYGAGAIAKDNNGLVGASVLVTAIDGIQLKVGGSIILTDPDSIINVGLGVAYTGDGFGVKARVGVVMQGDGDPFITLNIMPVLAAGEKGQALFDIGITSQGDELGWSVIPAYRLSIPNGAFKIGLQVFNNVGNKDGLGGNVGISGLDYVRWNIPMLLSFNF